MWYIHSLYKFSMIDLYMSEVTLIRIFIRFGRMF